jgi:hypothetical protein
VFKTAVETEIIDLRAKPFVRDRRRWIDPNDSSKCQAFARTARDASVGAIRYESVRDPQRSGCCAVLSPLAFVALVPLEYQTWMLSVRRERVVWQRSDALVVEEIEFPARMWRAPGSSRGSSRPT